MIADTPCPILVEAIVDSSRWSVVQQVIDQRSLKMRAVHEEPGSVTVFQLQMSSERDAASVFGNPKYVADQDALRKVGADFSREERPLAEKNCKLPARLSSPVREMLIPTNIVLSFELEGGRRAVELMKQLSVTAETFVGSKQLIIQFAPEKIGTILFRAKRGDFGKYSFGVRAPADRLQQPAQLPFPLVK